jgi:membrane-associated phospholipid phosphatase
VTDVRATALLGVAFAVALAHFRGLPETDLAVAALFHDAAAGTWVGGTAAGEMLREVLWMAAELSVPVFAAGLLAALVRHGRAAETARLWGFGLAAMALGPGLLVNGLLKTHWHRPRPRSVTAFGGTEDFTPAWQAAGDCVRNCSFVSGEAAAVLTLALVLWLIAGRHLAGAVRLVAGGVLVAAVLVTSGLRLASGGHFLSDVVFAWLLCAMVTLALWRLSGADRAAAVVTPAALRADIVAPFAALGRAIRGLLSKGPGPK